MSDFDGGEWVLRVPLIEGGGFRSKDHERIARSLRAVLEHMTAAGVDSSGSVTSPHGGRVASWSIEPSHGPADDEHDEAPDA